MRKAASLLERGQGNVIPETFWYTAKRRLLGPPMINAQLREQRLSKFLALGVLSPDGISSSAYGTEEILIELIQLFGIAAFAVLMPMTAVILFVMLLVVLLYREVVVVYTRAGGSYVVARDNFGPRIAQVAAVALLIDYVVTVAVQIAAGTAAVASAFPAIGPYVTEISIGVILLMCFGNLRGIREAGKIFALPTYLFAGSVILMIVVGIIREALGNLPQQNIYALHGLYPIGPGASSFTSLVIIFTLLKAFANGGASLTGIEAVSNAVSAFKPPEGINARRVLVMEGLILGTLVAGISWLAHLTHAAPYKLGFPTVISQEANIVFGSAGHFMFWVVQAATALILYTGGNTSFNGFPFLTSFVAEDSFLPRWLMKRGQRLVFSNGIIVLTVLSVTLIGVVGANVNALVPFYAIGVFTAFTMAGFGMAKYYRTHQVTRLAAQAGHLLLVRGAHLDRGGDLRGGEVHLGRLADPDHLPGRGVRADQAEPGVPHRGPGPAEPRRAPRVRRRSRGSRTTPAGWSSSSWTTSTWPPWPHCGTRRACGPRRCVPCTSSSTPSRRSGCGPPGCQIAACRWSSSTAPTGGSPGRPPSWSAVRRKRQARR